MNTETQIKVWDPAVRIFHWTLVVAFFAAYFSGEDLHDLHELTGYVVLVLVIFRLIWGFIGSEHARFANFVRGPGLVLANLRDIAMMHPKRYLGHSPAGGAMVVLLLALLAATTVTGIIADEQAESTPMVAIASDDDDDENGEKHEAEEGPIAELHETLGNLTLALVFLHIGGVILASFTHRENLARSMFTGKKSP